jgi:hypothetical protein
MYNSQNQSSDRLWRLKGKTTVQTWKTKRRYAQKQNESTSSNLELEVKVEKIIWATWISTQTKGREENKFGMLAPKGEKHNSGTRTVSYVNSRQSLDLMSFYKFIPKTWKTKRRYERSMGG